MKNTISIKFMMLLVLALMLGAFGSNRVAYGADRVDGVCYDDWAIAGTHIELRSLVPVKDIRKLAGEKLDGKLIKIRLCSEEGRFLYKLLVFQADGKVQKLAVDAKEPKFN